MKLSEVLQISAPPPFTVNVPELNVALPANPGVPISVSLQPGGNPVLGLITSVKVVECVRLGLELVPVIVRVNVPAGVEAEVEMLSVEEPEPPLIEIGLKVPLAPLGSPATLRFMVLLNPLSANSASPR